MLVAFLHVDHARKEGAEAARHAARDAENAPDRMGLASFEPMIIPGEIEGALHFWVSLTILRIIAFLLPIAVEAQLSWSLARYGQPAAQGAGQSIGQSVDQHAVDKQLGGQQLGGQQRAAALTSTLSSPLTWLQTSD